MLESMMLDIYFLNYFCEEDLGKGLKGVELYRLKIVCLWLIIIVFYLGYCFIVLLVRFFSGIIFKFRIIKVYIEDL